MRGLATLAVGLALAPPGHAQSLERWPKALVGEWYVLSGGSGGSFSNDPADTVVTILRADGTSQKYIIDVHVGMDSNYVTRRVQREYQRWQVRRGTNGPELCVEYRDVKCLPYQILSGKPRMIALTGVLMYERKP